MAFSIRKTVADARAACSAFNEAPNKGTAIAFLALLTALHVRRDNVNNKSGVSPAIVRALADMDSDRTLARVYAFPANYDRDAAIALLRSRGWRVVLPYSSDHGARLRFDLLREGAMLIADVWDDHTLIKLSRVGCAHVDSESRCFAMLIAEAGVMEHDAQDHK